MSPEVRLRAPRELAQGPCLRGAFRCSLRRVTARAWRLTVGLAGAVLLGASLPGVPARAEEPQYYLLPRPLLAQAQVPAQPAPSVEPERPKPVRPQEQLLLERGAILLRRGTLQVEPSVDYTHFSSDRVAVAGFTILEAIVIGTIRVDKLDRDVVTTALTLRYGLLDRLQLDVRVPYVYRQDREVLAVGTSAQTERFTHGSGIGDVEATVLGQVLIGSEFLPDVILKLRTRFPTGTSPFDVPTEPVPGGVRLKEAPTGNGFYSVAPGANLVWRADPVVFFLGGAYSMNLEREQARFGTIDPGDTVELLAGLNLAVSERIGVSMSFLNQTTGSTVQNGRRATGTSFTDARLILGTSIAVAPNVSLLFSVGAGLTRESPDYSVTLSLPIGFKLF